MLKQLPVIFICVSTIFICAKAHAAGKAGITRDYGVKLCGREFIRAVIFTCGGSRWKRSENALSLQSKVDPSYSALLNGEDMLSWYQHGDASGEHPHTSVSSGVDRHAFSEFKNPELDLDKSLQRWSGRLQGKSMTLGDPQEENGNVSWPSPRRRKRNFSLGLAGMCCNQGCTKNDIGRLC